VGTKKLTVAEMQPNRKKPPNAGKGRPKGVVNKLTMDVKEAINHAADRLGGPERLASWAKESPENERAFWTQVWVKIVPKDINASVTVNNWIDALKAIK
jgi:hypothetical protein